MGLLRQGDGAGHHGFLAFAFMAQGTNRLDGLARCGGNLLRTDFCTTHRAPHAGIKVDHLAPRFLQHSARVAPFLLLGILGQDQ